MNKEPKYESTYKEKYVRQGNLKVGKEVYKIEYTHYPNFVRRSAYTGLAHVVGKTHAKLTTNGTVYETEAECWIMEPFTFERGEEVATGRLLKQMNLPTILAKEVKVE